MQFFLEFFPVLAFAGVYVFSDIFYATAALMAALVLQFAVFKFKGWPITRQMWVILIIAIFTGTLTIALRDPVFIKWKPTVVSWLMCVFLIGSQYVGKRNLFELFLGNAWKFSARGTLHLSWIVGTTMFLSGCANLAVAYTVREEVWVAYRFASIFIWPTIMIAASALYLYRSGEIEALKEIE